MSSLQAHSFTSSTLVAPVVARSTNNGRIPGLPGGAGLAGYSLGQLEIRDDLRTGRGETAFCAFANRAISWTASSNPSSGRRESFICTRTLDGSRPAFLAQVQRRRRLPTVHDLQGPTPRRSRCDPAMRVHEETGDGNCQAIVEIQNISGSVRRVSRIPLLTFCCRRGTPRILLRESAPDRS